MGLLLSCVLFNLILFGLEAIPSYIQGFLLTQESLLAVLKRLSDAEV